MSHLCQNDVNFLIKETKLSPEKLVSLVEQPVDFDLVLQSISKRDIPRKTLYELSFFTFCKLLVFKYSFGKDYSLEEKLYVANTIYKYFPRLQSKINFGYLSTGEQSEKLSQYYFILMGFFYKKLKDNFFTPSIWRKVEDGLRAGSCRNAGVHLREWVAILHEIEKDDWLLTSRTKGIKVCQPKNLVITR